MSSPKVGDLVRVPVYEGRIGIIVEVDDGPLWPVYVIFGNGPKGVLYDFFDIDEVHIVEHIS